MGAPPANKQFASAHTFMGDKGDKIGRLANDRHGRAAILSSVLYPELSTQASGFFGSHCRKDQLPPQAFSSLQGYTYRCHHGRHASFVVAGSASVYPPLCNVRFKGRMGPGCLSRWNHIQVTVEDQARSFLRAGKRKAANGVSSPRANFLQTTEGSQRGHTRLYELSRFQLPSGRIGGIYSD